MSDFENAKSPASVSPRTWDFMETTFVSLIAAGVFVLAGQLTISIMLATDGGTTGLSPAQFEAVWMQGRWQGAGTIAAAPATVAVLWIAIRMIRRDFAEYLALKWPSAGELWRGVAIVTMVLVAESFVAYAVGQDVPQDPTAAPLLVVGDASGLLALLIGSCIAGPILEEFVFRGFMFRGWSQSFLGPIGAIVLTSAVWAVYHTQYDWFGRLEIFVVGLVLGHLRWRSNSTWLTVVLHSAMNTVYFFLIGPYI
ncbi:CPBP family intramembrane metalloprotease [Bradyrhizobium sp. Arg237L]|uniref:CPBP family intramembrane glutamic endopeptidase n=1 Tax=Bradyrhizobium sp. Arg237L TaxID=3003352 RepID=UPI00249F4048|nr:CPBP family intramembrane glutamic endopeptidase [Bradyrhizobium sp. Arg237L]MDI4236963.1 CPBP family intramembrane metalloprotease [Bradyrhizobium sp. Arg237L]